MTTAFLKSTAAAALVMLSMGAQAESVTLNFDQFTPGTTQIEFDGTDVGLVFSGAFVQTAQTAAGGMSPGGDTGDPFIGNRGPNVDGVSIEFKLAKPYANRYLRSLTFDLYAAGGSQPLGFGFSGPDDVAEVSLDLTQGSSEWTTVVQKKDFDLDLRINRIVFTPQGSGVLALDNLKVVFYDADTGTVPEPASYALVALALLAAGGASRRRKA